MSHKFIDSLKFFDRDNISHQKLLKLRTVVVANLDLMILKTASKAILPIYKWLTALVDYHNIKNTLDPKKKDLKEAEDTLAQVHYPSDIHTMADFFFFLFSFFLLLL